MPPPAIIAVGGGDAPPRTPVARAAARATQASKRTARCMLWRDVGQAADGWRSPWTTARSVVVREMSRLIASRANIPRLQDTGVIRHGLAHKTIP